MALKRRRSIPRCHCSAYGVSFSNECPSTRGLAAWSSAVVSGLTCAIDRKRIVDGPDHRKVRWIGGRADVLRDRVRHLLPDHVRRRRLLRIVGDGEPGAQNRGPVAEEVVGQAEPRREVSVPRLLVDRPAGAVFAGVNEPQIHRVVVHDLVVLFGLGLEDLVAQAGVDREAGADLEVVLDEQAVLLAFAACTARAGTRGRRPVM